MATTLEVNSELDATVSGFGARIIQSIASDSTISYYVDGGTYAPGRLKWISCTISDSAAVQAAAIKAALTEG